ncbi:MAG: nickel pincer cofactor biosynthesis protein LarC [Thermodesulfobacteriota bacterium]|nr:nickel pincer cofactor biosynthesis protein LarC [Thermodesulfobacteriota bacterium]
MIAYFDLFSGISGDMTLGALVDLGVPPAWLKEKISALPLEGFDIRGEHVWHNGIKGVTLFVDVDDHSPARNYMEIKKLITSSSLSDRVKTLSLSAFEKIARAESKIHGSDLEKVHFHEVGGIDAIVDIVGSFLGVEYLDIKSVSASKISLGSGSAVCSHGAIPVPVPAVTSILKGCQIKPSGVDMELVTPTGAAIITTLTTQFGDIPDMVMGDSGYGAGKRTRNDGLPNLLRIITGTPDPSLNRGPFKANTTCRQESIFLVETSIDDMNSEISGYVMEQLFNAGALDVCYLPLHMKKNRPGTRMEIICSKKNLPEILELLLTETTTTGVRYHEQNRVVLDRSQIAVKTRFGVINAKQITAPDGKSHLSPEFESCRTIARDRGLPLKDVYHQVCLDMDRVRL